MHRFLIVVSTLLLVAPALNAQSHYDDEDPFIKRCFTGGNVGLSLGTISLVEISPVFGYNITHQLSGGLGLTWINYSQRVGNQRYTQNILGTRVFSRYLLANPNNPEALPFLTNVFAHAELEALRFKEPNSTIKPYIALTPLAGLGFRNQIGQNSFYTLSLLYNLDYNNPNNPYSGTSLPLVFKGGLIIGF